MADNEMNDSQIDSSKEFYGENAITGSEADSDVSVSNVTGQTIQLSTEGASSLTSEDSNETPEDNTDEEKTSEEATEEETNDESSGLDQQVASSDKAIEALGKDLIAKGVDFVRAIEEYQEDGELSQATYEALSKAGYPKEVIQGFVESRKAIDEAYTREVYNYVGGQKEYQQIATWMKGNLSKSEIDSFNEAINDNNLGMVKLMLDGIQAKRVAKQGTRKATIMGAPSNASSQSKGFSSKDDMIKAMSDKRYGVDRNYTLGVERKMFYTQGIF